MASTSYRRKGGLGYGIAGENHRDNIVEAANRYVNEITDIDTEVENPGVLQKGKLSKIPRFTKETGRYGGFAGRFVRVYNHTSGATDILRAVVEIVGPSTEVEDEWDDIKSEIKQESGVETIGI